MQHLATAWISLAQRVAARGDVAGAGAALLARWAEPHRRYHDLSHLAAVLERVDLLAGEAQRPDTVRLAAWFHDAVYDPQATDNEERSAELAMTTLAGLALEAATVDDVARLVRLTAGHDVRPGDRDAAVLCDADLAVLALPGSDYSKYVVNVRAEYAHLDEATFRAGRSALLRSLLDRPTLFLTAHGRTSWESPARVNVERELADLAG